jgi:hypothetical protein
MTHINYACKRPGIHEFAIEVRHIAKNEPMIGTIGQVATRTHFLDVTVFGNVAKF